jgi:hypothetical protein
MFLNMGKLITLRLPKTPKLKSDENLVCAGPLEFRKSHWKNTDFIQISRSKTITMPGQRGKSKKDSDRLEEHPPPPHFLLKGGLADTARSLFFNRKDEARLREVYYLAGLVDCLINQVNPILRTDLLKALYKEIFALREKLNIHWHGHLEQVLLPIESVFYNEFEYKTLLREAPSLKDLHLAIRQGTDEMFDILSLEYVFYCPYKIR